MLSIACLELSLDLSLKTEETLDLALISFAFQAKS